MMTRRAPWYRFQGEMTLLNMLPEKCCTIFFLSSRGKPMSSNKKFAITAFIGTILLLAMFGVKALLYAPIFLVVGLIMLFLAPGGKSGGADKS